MMSQQNRFFLAVHTKHQYVQLKLCCTLVGYTPLSGARDVPAQWWDIVCSDRLFAFLNPSILLVRILGFS